MLHLTILNIEDYSIGSALQEDYTGALVILSVLFGIKACENKKDNSPWWRRFER